MAGSMRKYPNILVSGTPGTGKSTLCKKLAKKVKELKVIDFGKEAKEKDCREEYDEALECWVIDEEKLADLLTPQLTQGGLIIDYMHANIYSDTSLIDLVITLHTNNTVLFDRYTERGYSQRKIDENIDCEIMNVIGMENKEYFEGIDEDGERVIDEEEIVTTHVEMSSDGDEDLKNNIETLVKWLEKWQQQRKEYTEGKAEEWMRVSIDEV